MADGEAIKTEIIEDEDEGRLAVITVETKAIEAILEHAEATAEAETLPKDNEPAKKPVRRIAICVPVFVFLHNRWQNTGIQG